VWLLTGIVAPAHLEPGATVTLKAHASWLVCKDVCIPEDVTLTLLLNTAAAPIKSDPAIEAFFVAARARLPVVSPWTARYGISGGKLALYLAAPPLARAGPVSAEFFPLSPTALRMSAPQSFGIVEDGIVIDLTASKRFRPGPVLSGVAVFSSRDGSVQALAIDAKEGSVPPTSTGGMTLALALVFAFLGGLILNLMPCVLPVLAMKAVALARNEGMANARREALAYGAGAILAFAALGAALILLRAGGAWLGWGFQLQEPVAVGAFALLMFAVGLNFSGVYELNPVTAGDSLARGPGATGSFFTGLLAVAVAAPCTAPFMATALGFALAQSNLVALLTFIALGIGFALPFVLLELSQAFRRLLPKPGQWMESFKQVLAFAMYGTAVWLIWVLAQETNALGVAATLFAFVLFAFAAWLWTRTRLARVHRRKIGATAALVLLLASVSCLGLLKSTRGAVASLAGPMPSVPFSDAKLQSFRLAHRAVFVDATASWCITCLVNDEAVLARPEVRAAFGRNHVVFLLADFTNRNSEGARLLSAHGRAGVPLYLYYPPASAEPHVLPQILTEGEVLSALSATN
jgi:thiol:disulfide interchange protein DsbD